MQKSHTKIILQNKSTFPRRYKETVILFHIFYYTMTLNQNSTRIEKKGGENVSTNENIMKKKVVMGNRMT